MHSQEPWSDLVWTLFYFVALLVGILTGGVKPDNLDTRKRKRRHR